MQRDLRRGPVEHVLTRWHRPYLCLGCGTRFFNRPLPRRPAHHVARRRWTVAVVGCLLAGIVGGGIVLWESSGSQWVLGVNLLVLGALGLTVSAIGVWMTRDGPGASDGPPRE